MANFLDRNPFNESSSTSRNSWHDLETYATYKFVGSQAQSQSTSKRTKAFKEPLAKYQQKGAFSMQEPPLTGYKGKISSRPAWPSINHWLRQYLPMSGFECSTPTQQADALPTRPFNVVLCAPIHTNTARILYDSPAKNKTNASCSLSLFPARVPTKLRAVCTLTTKGVLSESNGNCSVCTPLSAVAVMVPPSSRCPPAVTLSEPASLAVSSPEPPTVRAHKGVPFRSSCEANGLLTGIIRLVLSGNLMYSRRVVDEKERSHALSAAASASSSQIVEKRSS